MSDARQSRGTSLNRFPKLFLFACIRMHFRPLFFFRCLLPSIRRSLPLGVASRQARKLRIFRHPGPVARV